MLLNIYRKPRRLVMQITYLLELLKPTNKKANLIEENIKQVQMNRISVANKLKAGEKNLSSKEFSERLPSAVKNQNIREVKALYKLFEKSPSKKDNLDFKRNQPICYNNQNYRIENYFVSFPLYSDKSKRYWFPVIKNENFNKLKEHLDDGAKLGKASLFKKGKKYYFAVTLKIEVEKALGSKIMGIDIGLNQLAVASIKDKNGRELDRLFYNGKEAGFIRKKYRSLRRSLGRAKKTKKIREIKDKESRYIRDLNHKISRQLIDLAVQEGVATIVMEDLKNIRKTAFSLKKADKNLNSWSFYELQSFIDYKARLSGIKVVYINPKYTSQTCNKCKSVEKSNRKRNLYKCSCGNQVHADLNAARNICDIGLEAVNQQSA